MYFRDCLEMGKMKKLKNIRVVLSIVLLLMATAIALDVGGALPEWFPHLDRIQFMPALLSFGIGVDVFWLACSIMFGRIYCSSVCPLGTFQDFFGYLGRKVFRKKGYRYSFPKNGLRYAVLIGMLASACIGFLALPLLIDPYSAYSRIAISIVYSGRVADAQDQLIAASLLVPGLAGIALSAITALAVAYMSFFHGRTYCNTICPVGTALGICSRNSIWHFEIDTDKCVDCGRCEEACKASCIDLSEHVVDMSRCVVCFNCIKECGDDAISYTPERKRPATPLMQRIKEKAVGNSSTATAVTMTKTDPSSARK